jgi:hypothetical protein
MAAIAHMPDSAVGDGATDDTTALQAMFNACPVGGLCLIPDGVFRVTSTVQVPRPMSVWCSPGAHIKGDFAGTGAVVWAFWHTPDGTSDLYTVMQNIYWQGGTISRLNRNGPCLRVSAAWTGSVQNVRTLKGSPHIQMDSPDPSAGGYTVGSFSNYAAVSRVAACRGYDGGPVGVIIGELTKGGNTAFVNGDCLDHCYFEGDGSAGSIGAHLRTGSAVLWGNTFVNYETGLRYNSPAIQTTAISNKMNSVTQHVFGTGTNNRGVLIHPRGWEAGRGTFANIKARDPKEFTSDGAQARVARGRLRRGG